MNIKKILGLDEIIEPSAKKMTEEEIEAERKRFWRCPKCHELTEIEEKMCWKCYADKPLNFEHPTTEEIKKHLKINASATPFVAGGLFLFLGFLAFLRAWVWEFDIIDLIFIGLFLAGSAVLFIYGLYRKISDR
ncbi:MAG: hypothetical protein NT092_05260 [Bacteroidia bacterium]|nr:hypothetical protein [Bacteroidia bacterium]